MQKAGFTSISLDAYVDLHVKANSQDWSRQEVVAALRSALANHQKGVRCACGNPTWVIGSAFVGSACFTCITGEAYPEGDYELDEAL